MSTPMIPENAATEQVDATDNETMVDGDEAKRQVKGKYDSGAADLERVTDYAEEKEVVSEEQFQGAMTLLHDRRNKEVAEKIAKENELSRVSIRKEDVDLIANEMEIPRNVAERKLREHLGNVVNALVELTN